MPTRVLVAEDNLVNLKVAKFALQQAGYTVDSVLDGCAAVNACSSQDYDVVLMDCQMPTMDGLEATRLIRKLGKRQPVIIAVTAHALVGDREKCLDSGMDDYLSKPYRAQQLILLVRKYLEQPVELQDKCL